MTNNYAKETHNTNLTRYKTNIIHKAYKTQKQTQYKNHTRVKNKHYTQNIQDTKTPKPLIRKACKNI